jgi:hypothetical protein
MVQLVKTLSEVGALEHYISFSLVPVQAKHLSHIT